MNCKTCLYVKRGDKGLACHYNAPSPLTGGTGTGWSDWQWPLVKEEDFCGKWSVKATSSVPESYWADMKDDDKKAHSVHCPAYVSPAMEEEGVTPGECVCDNIRTCDEYHSIGHQLATWWTKNYYGNMSYSSYKQLCEKFGQLAYKLLKD